MEEQGGVVIKSTGSWFTVKTEAGKIVHCKIKGKFRTQNIRHTNPVAVGDRVSFTTEPDGAGVIDEIFERKNYIIRKSVNLSKRAHIIASNIDQALLLVTLNQPVTYPGFIDRFLVTAEAYHIPVSLIFNKTDLYSENELSKMKFLISTYEKIGYTCYTLCANDASQVSKLKNLFQNNVSLVTGHSGAGKSTLINSLDPSIQLKTNEISEYHKSGKHTTTFAEMHELYFKGSIIDTPGIKGLGVIDIPKETLSHYFPEIRAVLDGCKFHNCIHINEPSCAVKEAVEKGEVESFRYKNYISIYNDDEEESYRTLDY